MPFSFINRIKLRMKDMGTIRALCEEAETYARKNGEESPGAEHFLLSALDLPDGTARRVFGRIGVESDQIENAIRSQHNEALSFVGMDVSKAGLTEDDIEIGKGHRILYESKPSAQSMMKALAELRKCDKDIPLRGLHVLEVLSSKDLGVVARTLKLMGVNKEAFKEAIQKELDHYKLSLK